MQFLKCQTWGGFQPNSRSKARGKNTSHFYYTHSYEFQPSDRNCICATTAHGGREIAPLFTVKMYCYAISPGKKWRRRFKIFEGLFL